MNQKFLEAVGDNDIIVIRLFLSNELLMDPRGQSFLEMLEYAESHCPNLYENNESTFNINNDSSFWNQSYLNELKNELDSHFRKELLMHYKDVAGFVLRDKAKHLDSQERESSKPQDKKDVKRVCKAVACGTALVGGTAFLAAGLSTSGLSIAGVFLSKGMMVKTGIICLLLGSYATCKFIKNNNEK